MDCRRAEELLSDHCEGTLSPPVRGEVDKHLEECARCRALLEALSSVIDALHSFPLLEPGSGLAERVAAAALARPRRARGAAAPRRSPPGSRRPPRGSRSWSRGRSSS